MEIRGPRGRYPARALTCGGGFASLPVRTMTSHEDARRLMPFQEARNRIERARYLAGVFQTGQDSLVLRDFIRTLRGALDSAIVDIAHVRAKDPEGVTFPLTDDAQQLDHLCEV